LSQTGGWYPDVQIIMSADAPLVRDHGFVIDGGYIVHASSNPAYTGVSRKSGELCYAVLSLRLESGPQIIENYF
jgi:hypothetical protein